MKTAWVRLAAQADKDGWPAARFLAALAEHEVADRGRRRIERHLVEARLPAGKTLASFDFEAVPMVSKAQMMALAAGDAWLEKGANVLIFGPPSGGKSHLSAALGLALVENGWRGDERRELSPTRGYRAKARARQTSGACDAKEKRKARR